MGRTPDPQRKYELISDSVPYVLSNGVATLSLRPLAAHLDTSARNLLYHFETSAKLLELIMDEIKLREIESLKSEIKGTNTELEIKDVVSHHLESFKSTLRAYVEYSFSISFENAHRRSYLSDLISKWRDVLQNQVSADIATSPWVERQLDAVFGLVLEKLAEIQS